MTEAETFMEELLQEAEDKELKLEEAQVDLIILELQNYEKQIEKNFQTAQSEMDIINSWALAKNTKIKDKGDFLKLKLKAYIKERGIKTLDLAHGILKLRQSPQRVEVSDLSAFLAGATADMITIQPEQVKPNLTLIKNYINSKGRVPNGIQVIEGTENFIIKFKEIS